MGTSLFVFLWRILNLYHCYYQNVLCRQSIAYVFSLIKKKSTFWILLPSVEYHCAGLWDIAVISSAQDHQAVCLDMVWSGPWRGALGVWECLAEHWSSLRVSGGGWSVEAGRRPHSWDPRRESIVPDHPWAASASAHWITEDLPPTGSFFFFGNLIIWHDSLWRTNFFVFGFWNLCMTWFNIVSVLSIIILYISVLGSKKSCPVGGLTWRNMFLNTWIIPDFFSVVLSAFSSFSSPFPLDRYQRSCQ